MATDLVLNSSGVTINSDQLIDEKLFSELKHLSKAFDMKTEKFRKLLIDASTEVGPTGGCREHLHRNIAAYFFHVVH